MLLIVESYNKNPLKTNRFIDIICDLVVLNLYLKMLYTNQNLSFPIRLTNPMPNFNQTMFRILDKIGQGEFGHVYLVKWKGAQSLSPVSKLSCDCEYYDSKNRKFLSSSPPQSSKELISSQAIYVIKYETENSLEEKSTSLKATFLFSEHVILENIAHPFIIGYVGRFKIEHNSGQKGYCLIQEFFLGKTLADYLSYVQKTGASRVTEKNAFFILFQLAMAFEYLHDRKIYHLDLKSANMLINSKGLVKIVDFGLSEDGSKINSQVVQSTTVVGSPNYMSPEVIRALPHDQKADCWSVGVMYYKLLSLCNPFNGETTAQLANKIVNVNPPLPPNLSSDEQQILQGLLCKNPSARHP